MLFSLAVAVGITPQLLPAVVSTSLATGSRRLAEKKVLVKRLVCIEDLGDIDVLFTDKTGTLTDGHVSFERAIDPSGNADADVLTLGLICNEATPIGSSAIGGNPLDVALWEAPGVAASNVADFQRIALAPFDHDRRCVSVLVHGHDQRILIVKGAPKRFSTVASTSRRKPGRCSKMSSAPVTAWSQSPPGKLPNWPRCHP